MEPKLQQGTELPPIPTPAGTRWREFRVTYLPLVTFVITLFAIWRLWLILPPSMGVRGIGEGAVSLITAPQDGFLEGVPAQSYAWIEAGTRVATVTPFDPRSQLSVFQTQLQLSRLALEPTLTDRNALNYEQLRVDSLRLKQELAMAKANLERAEKVLPRHEALLREKLLSQDVYDSTLRDREFFKAEVSEKTKAISAIDQRLEQLSAFSVPAGTNSGRILPDLEKQIAAVRTNWSPVTLSAPISGEVVLYRRAGEFVRAGELIAAVNSPKADRIIAYIKQPIQFEPEVGMEVEVVTRSNKPQRFTTAVAQVGARVEVITNAIAYHAAGAVVDTGLPFVLPVPENVRIRPGEIVEVLWTRAGRKQVLAREIARK